jgi:hypothetical protein
MTRRELEHAIRAACDVADYSEVWVFGSQSILGQFPDAPAVLRQSAEADIAPRNHPERVDQIDGALGELSQSHRTSKLVAFREKDREFVRVLLAEQMIDSATLLARIA